MYIHIIHYLLMYDVGYVLIDLILQCPAENDCGQSATLKLKRGKDGKREGQKDRQTCPCQSVVLIRMMESGI